jgi:RHS repeat-associated protein
MINICRHRNNRFEQNMFAATAPTTPQAVNLKHYTISNHLGNVLTVFSDKKVPILSGTTVIGYNPTIVSNSDYSPFGVELDGRTSVGSYRYGFNGMEADDEAKGDGNTIAYEHRNYDPRNGRMWSVDPLASKLPSDSPYSFSLNNPILYFDPDGAFPYPIHIRSFAPFETFGGGFSGDGSSRGFTTSLSATSRVAQRFVIDPSAGSKSGLKTWSDPSHHSILGSKTEKPVGSISNFSSSKDDAGNAIVSFTAKMSGANPLVPGSPDIDVSTTFKMTENIKKGKLQIKASQVGDKFPAAETFITDTKGNNLFIGVSPYEGNPYTSLPGDNNKSMMNSEFTVNINDKGVFQSVSMGKKNYTIEAWNDIMKNTSTGGETSNAPADGGSFGGGGSGGKY